MSNTKWKRAAVYFPPPSFVKDSAGAETLLTMTHSDDEIGKDYSSEGEHSNGSNKNGVASLPPEPTLSLPPEPILLPSLKNKQYPRSNGNDIYSTPILGSFMQCDTCIGAGILPIPMSTISTLRTSQKDLLPNRLPISGACANIEEILQNNICESSVTCQFKDNITKY